MGQTTWAADESLLIASSRSSASVARLDDVIKDQVQDTICLECKTTS